MEGILGSPPEAPTRARDDVERTVERTAVRAVGLLLAFLWLVNARLLWLPAGADRLDPNLRVVVQPADGVSLVLVGLWWLAAGPRALRLHWRSGLLALITAGLAVVVLAALAVHPSPRGVEMVLRLAAAAATADLIRRVSTTAWTRILAVVVAAGSVQALLGLAQSARGGTVGISAVEYSGPLYRFGSSFAGRGSFGHPYHLASLLVVACGAAAVGAWRSPRRWPWPWLAGLALSAAALATTYSRAGALGLLALLGVLLVAAARARDRAPALAALALVLGFAVGGLAFGDGWVARSSQTTNASALDSGRRVRAAEAIRLTRRHRLLGVGPGRYVIALQQTGVRDALPAHNLPLQAAAEAGVLAGVLAAAALGGLALRAWRGGVQALALFLPLAPFTVLDAYPYVFPTGIALSGVWLGLVLHHRSSVGRDGRSARVEEHAVAGGSSAPTAPGDRRPATVTG
ncbi:MAG: O-antigen ligase family protein [Actinobacteria bacterium]|nr:O-antigen ligase family protein [Actinomycetota bacterium]